MNKIKGKDILGVSIFIIICESCRRPWRDIYHAADRYMVCEFGKNPRLRRKLDLWPGMDNTICADGCGGISRLEKKETRRASPRSADDIFCSAWIECGLVVVVFRAAGNWKTRSRK